MKCPINGSLTIFRSFEKMVKFLIIPFSKTLRYGKQIKSKIRLGMTWIPISMGKLSALPIPNRACFGWVGDSRFDLFLFYPLCSIQIFLESNFWLLSSINLSFLSRISWNRFQENLNRGRGQWSFIGGISPNSLSIKLINLWTTSSSVPKKS